MAPTFNQVNIKLPFNEADNKACFGAKLITMDFAIVDCMMHSGSTGLSENIYYLVRKDHKMGDPLEHVTLGSAYLNSM